MKKVNLASLFIFLSFGIFLSCEKDNKTTDGIDSNATDLLPSKFKVEVPSSISQSGSAQKSASVNDTLQGNQVYKNLRTFIFVGVSAGDVIDNIINAIRVYKINRPMSLSFVSKEDNRTKYLEVLANQTYNNENFKYGLTIKDSASSKSADEGKALQVFWNTNPVHGIAIIKPYNINREKELNNPNAMYRIEYSEIADANYDTHMVVEIDSLTMPNALTEPFALSALKMFVGKKGNRVDVYGNSEHPNARFFTDNTGFDWAFTASTYTDQNIGIAEVGLPPYQLNNDSRKVLLEDYSIKNVLTQEINSWFLERFHITPDSASLSKYLKNADAPGYFNNGGFIQAGTSPGTQYNALEQQIKTLIPYNPVLIWNMSIKFK